MSRFATKKTIKHDLKDGEFVEFRSSLSYKEMEAIMVLFNGKDDTANMKLALPLLGLAIVGWNLKDESGVAVPYAEDKISELEMNTVLELVEFATTTYFPDKKKLQTSEK